MPGSPADWQLPPGVNRGLWDYLHDARLARSYDAQVAGSTLLTADQRFAEHHFDRPGRLIDLGCGTGRLLIPFARRGYWVLGVDLSEEMLAVAGDKARAAGVPVQLLKANVVELDGLADASFDYAACLFSTLGMVRGAGHRRRVVGHVYRLLRPGGKFVLHVHNRWFNVWDRPGRRWLLANGIASLFGRAERGDRLMPVHQGIAGLTLHLFTRREALRLLREAGFRALEVCPVGLGAEGRLAWPWWFPGLRSYGYLLAAEREE
jgi:ubiquinone/menaquinone biosynthesis C-methylase UbiE